MHPMQLGLSTRNDAEQGEQKLLYLLLSIGLVLAAGLMSGLTLGLMSMDSESDLHAFQDGSQFKVAAKQVCHLPADVDLEVRNGALE